MSASADMFRAAREVMDEAEVPDIENPGPAYSAIDTGVVVVPANGCLSPLAMMSQRAYLVLQEIPEDARPQ